MKGPFVSMETLIFYSLMVEELAKWKSALAIRTNELQEVLKTFLDERKRVQKKNAKTYTNLKVISEKLKNDLKNVELKYGNVIEVANVNQELSEEILRALNLEEESKKSSVNLIPAQVTVAEKTAIKASEIYFYLLTKSIFQNYI